jgi:hypothetical protein
MAVPAAAIGFSSPGVWMRAALLAFAVVCSCFVAQAASANESAPSLAPAARDELFGVGKPTDEAPKGARIGGFVESLVAYTYADPSHWSRAVTRLQLVGQGQISDGIKWKVGVRADVDPVYFESDFYLPDVKKDQRADVFWRENYLDFSAGDWDFRLGAQNIVWGEVIGLFFADVVSARDMREFLLPPFDVIRIPQWAARAEYTWNDSHLELVWIPIPVFDNIGKPGSDFHPARMPSPTPQPVADLFLEPVKPARTLSNSNYGVRANTLVSGWDLAAFYYRSFNTHPTWYPIAPAAPGQPVRFEPRYDRIWQVGGTVTKDFGESVMRAEAVYTEGLNFTLADVTASPGTNQRSTFDWIVSFEWPFAVDSRFNVQLFQRYIDGGDDDLFVKSGGLGASIFVSYRPDERWELQLLYIQSFADAGGLIRPRVNWYPAQNWAIGFGVDIFTGPDFGYFGRYDNRDRVYTEARFTF